MELLMIIATSMTLILGMGAITVASIHVWGYAFDCGLRLLKIHGLFVNFIYDYYKKKRKKDQRPVSANVESTFKPSIKRKEDE